MDFDVIFDYEHVSSLMSIAFLTEQLYNRIFTEIRRKYSQKEDIFDM